jgi:predicted SprT family Zn-dependent metalloprotease
MPEEYDNMREKFYRFMQGRYGQDQFYRFLIGAALVSIVLNLFFQSRILSLIGWVLLIYAVFRAFSKNYQARYAENQKYLQMTAKARYWLDQQKKLHAERKVHHIYTCPKCKQKIRIPKGKGKIMVRCPKCQHEFQRRS